VPEAHGWHTASSALTTDPSVQLAQRGAEAEWYAIMEPAGQNLQVAAPAAPNRPRGQGKHCAAPAALEFVPGAQGKHNEPASEKEPAAQLVQAPAFGGELEPAAQALHVVAPLCEKKPAAQALHTGEPAESANVPGAHAAQADAPGADVVPTGQAWQAVAPAPDAKKPAAQLRHEGCPCVHW